MFILVILWIFDPLLWQRGGGRPHPSYFNDVLNVLNALFIHNYSPNPLFSLKNVLVFNILPTLITPPFHPIGLVNSNIIDVLTTSHCFPMQILSKYAIQHHKWRDRLKLAIHLSFLEALVPPLKEMGQNSLEQFWSSCDVLQFCLRHLCNNPSPRPRKTENPTFLPPKMIFFSCNGIFDSLWTKVNVMYG